MNRSRFFFNCLVLLLVGIGTASASGLGTNCANFGTLSAATFGGGGIPNNAVCNTTITDGANTITLGLTATQRFANPPLTNNGAGVFFAGAGGDTLDAAPTYAIWNFDFYTNASGGNYYFVLLYDFDPGTGTDSANLGRVVLPAGYQESWNLGMAFLSNSAVTTPPSYPSFNPNAPGQYSFGLEVYDSSNNLLGSQAIEVQVAPEPVSLSLLGFGMVFVGWRRRW